MVRFCFAEKVPLKFISLVLHLFYFIMCEKISYAGQQVSINAVHIAWRGYNCTHILVAIINTFFYLKNINITHLLLNSHTNISHSIFIFQEKQMNHSGTFTYRDSNTYCYLLRLEQSWGGTCWIDQTEARSGQSDSYLFLMCMHMQTRNVFRSLHKIWI